MSAGGVMSDIVSRFEVRSRPSVKKTLRRAAVVLSAFALQAWALRDLYRKGLVDKLIPWDECVFIWLALSNADHLKHGTLSGFQYAHSPLTLIPTSIALLLRPSLFAPYAVNALYLAGVFLFVNRLFEKRSFLAVIAFLLVFVSTPYMFVFTSYVKADFLGGVVLLVLLGWLFRPGHVGRPSAKDLAVPAALSILVLASKPMAFYLPPLLIGIFVLAGVHERLIGHSNADRRSVVTYYGLLSAIVVVAYTVLVIPNRAYFADYINQALSARWTSDFSPFQKALYYLPFTRFSSGPDGNFWGTNFPAYLIIVGGFMVAVAMSKERKPSIIGVVGLCSIALASLLPLVVSPQIHRAFGSFFAGSVVAVILYMLLQLQNAAKLAPFVNIALIAVSLWRLHPATHDVQRWIPTDERSMSEAKAVVDAFAAEMDPRTPGRPRDPSLFVTFTGAIPCPDFAIRLYQLSGALTTNPSEAFQIDEALLDHGLSAYHYVIMYSDSSKLAPINEANLQQDVIRQRIAKHWNLSELKRAPYHGAEYVLYRLVGPTS
jgi:hypothetical protein